MSKRLIGIILIILILVFCYLNITTEKATSAIWETEFNDKILSDPIPVAGKFVFWGGNKGKNLYKLYLINPQGQKIAESVSLPHLPFDPIVVGDKIIMADHGRMLRAFSSVDLKVLWELPSNDLFELPPSKCDVPILAQNNNSIVKKISPSVAQMSGKSIFCIDPQTGKQIWDVTLIDKLKNYASDKVLITIHGYKDIENSGLKCSAYDLEDGLDLWTLEEYVSKETPVFVKNTCVLTTSEGEAIVVDQLSGKVLLKNDAKGFIAVKGLEQGVLLANKSYTSLAYLSLLTGKSWTCSMKKDFIGAVQIGSRLIVADKVSLRCFNIDNGDIIWMKELGDIYGLVPHRNGVFVTYKDDFASRTTYGACLGADSSENLWLAKGNSIFKKPCPIADGDLLLNYDGSIRLMPKPNFKTLSTAPTPTVAMPDPTEKVNKVFETKTASSTKSLPAKTEEKKTNAESNKAIPSVIPTVSDEEAGW